jgi:alginate O-acetyltransferase complex protein AlgI
MTITSWSFVAFLVIAVLASHLAPANWRARVLFPVTTLIFVVLVMPSMLAVSALLGFIGLIWLATEFTFRTQARFPQILVLTVVLSIFGWLKAYEFLVFLPFSNQVPAVIGLSYILIRALQLLIDMAETPSLRPGLVSLFSFLTSWPSLISGPIQRYQDFREQLGSMGTFKLSEEVFVFATYRMATGYFMVLVLADMLKHLWTGLESIALGHANPLALAGAQGAFLGHLFFDFAGYTHIVIGAAYLFGLHLPENFDRPWQSKSFLEFWGRWHMTMSNWFKTYVFNSLLLQMIKRWPSSKLTNLHGVVAFFLTFFLVGLWHGTTSAYVICGLLLGIGASANHLYRIALRNWLGKRRMNDLSAKQTYILASAALTFTYVCFSVSPLWLSYEQIRQVVQSYRLPGLLLAQAALFVMMLIILPLIQRRLFHTSITGATWWRPLQIGVLCAVIDAYTFLFPALGGAFFYERF